MLGSQLAERFSLLCAKGGKIAGAYWLLRTILGIDTYCLYAVGLADFTHKGEPDLPEGYQLLNLENAERIAGFDPTILEEISHQSGKSVFNIVSGGGRVYAIVHDTEVVCQLNIEFVRSRVGVPLKMTLEFGKKDAFMSYVYTNPSWRRGRWASRLISQVCTLLGQEGWLHCTSHVQATNVKSSNTFRSCGWKQFALLYATTSGRLLGVVHRAAARDRGICVHAKLWRERI